jgi:hypothetical protein
LTRLFHDFDFIRFKAARTTGAGGEPSKILTIDSTEKILLSKIHKNITIDFHRFTDD